MNAQIEAESPSRRGREHPELRPVAGPSAFGGGTRRFFDLLWLTAFQNFRLQYRTSILGYAWTLLRPLAFFGVLYVVFSQVIRFGDAVPFYAVLLLMNIMLFQFFADATGTSVNAVTSGESVVRKMHFPRIVIPLAVVLASAMTSVLNLVVVFIYMLIAGVDPQWTWLLTPAIVLPLVVYTAGTALLLSMAYVRMRDIGHVWAVVTRTLFYGSPILYPLELVPESFRWVIALNPLTPMLYQARKWLVHPDAEPLVDVIGVLPLIASIAIGVGICVLGVWIFIRRAPRVAEEI